MDCQYISSAGFQEPGNLLFTLLSGFNVKSLQLSTARRPLFHIFYQLKYYFFLLFREGNPSVEQFVLFRRSFLCEIMRAF
jgi:hypothetical protein